MLNTTATETAASASQHDAVASCAQLVDGLAALYGRHCEVALYRLDPPEGMAERLAGGNRQPGAAMTDAEQRLLAELQRRGEDRLCLTHQRLGAPVRSLVQAVRGAHGELAGLLCLHLDLGAPLHELMADLLPPENERPQASAENFSNNVEELVTLTVERTIDAINADPDVANNAKNKQIVTTLFEKGIFDIKDAIAMVSDKLNISKHTVYLYIRQKKRDDEASSPHNQENP
ncbi:helix-turn-helix domain-containing protein [Oceanimonas sp. CHS3-5]|uniref:helix-turn-helix transcriptional regulator n=1 Tax=Oceanimonas sp. CHS3-5 TaxID=3068186 RepID=UPI00273ED4A1|nr:helix-turn-helix domain-containing protein [Oceanimonas sp. CHS3-5]MDP5292018.1 helix-turn-helix domain-containing protein [Oceanimonas sp. CHS3-5]